MLISCHFQDWKAVLGLILTPVTSTIALSQTCGQIFLREAEPSLSENYFDSTQEHLGHFPEGQSNK